MKAIGPAFVSELAAAGLGGMAFGWSADGTLTFSAAMTQQQIDAVNEVYQAHDPDAPAPAAEKTAIDLAVEYVASKSDAPAELKAIVAQSAQLASAALKT